MHFALPPRKTSQPPVFTRAAHLNNAAQRRRQLQSIGYVVLGLATLYLIYKTLFTSGTTPEPTEIEANPSVVVVTIFDESVQSTEFIHQVKENRVDYARRHGYTNFFTSVSTYDAIISPSPSSWSMVPAMRHALTIHPTTTYLWSLSAYSLITNPALSLSSHIFSNLSSIMQRDIPVVPPDSVIRTFSHLKPINVQLILSQDMDNLAHGSLILRNAPPPGQKHPGGWALFLLDAWLDPLYRTYAFQKAEQHALEHMVQWHPTILAKLALIPQRMFNSYNFKYEEKEIFDPVEGRGTGEMRKQDAMWEHGDFVVNLKDCWEKEKKRNCEKEMSEYFGWWRKEVRKLDGLPVEGEGGELKGA